MLHSKIWLIGYVVGDRVAIVLDFGAPVLDNFFLQEGFI